VLCEDMGARGFTAGLVTSGPRLSQQSALAAITALARVHAWGWGGRERGERESKWTALIAGHLKLSHALLKNFHTDATLQTFLEVWSPREHASDLREPGLRSMLWDLRANFSSWFERGCNMPRDQTLLHGDFHLGNIFVKEDDEVMTQPDDVTVIDWAYMGAGHSSWELNYFLSLSCDGSHKDDMALLAAYHAELILRNPSITYTLEQCKADVQLTLFMQAVANFSDKAKSSKVVEYEQRLTEGGNLRDISVMEDRTRVRINSRLAGYYADKNSWGDFFSGAAGAAPEAAGSAAAAASAAGRGRKAKAVGKGVKENLI
jgi:hypothetical protein